MKKNLQLLLAVLFINITLSNAQNTTPLLFNPCYGKEAIHLDDSAYQANDKDSITISLFKFYVSGIELINDDSKVWAEANSYHLINAAEAKTLQLALSIPNNLSFNKIKFNLGIDSTTNVSGAMGGELDPLRGMYWTWQSGYINIKLEGTSPLCNTRHHGFEFHLGGYHHPFDALQTIILPLKTTKEIAINIDLKKLLGSLSLDKTNQIMTPSKEAVTVARKVADMFEISSK